MYTVSLCYCDPVTISSTEHCKDLMGINCLVVDQMLVYLQPTPDSMKKGPFYIPYVRGMKKCVGM